jgi:hypothetical protein
MTLSLAISALGVVMVLDGCDRQQPTEGRTALTPAEFIDAIVALRQAEREVERSVDPDSLAVEFARRREAILEEQGVTASQLHDFVERHHRRPGVMAGVWDSVTQRLRTDLGDAPVEEPMLESWYEWPAEPLEAEPLR